MEKHILPDNFPEAIEGETRLNREEFLKLAAAGVFVSVLPAFSVGCSKKLTDEKLSQRVQLMFIVDTTACIGCGFCIEACRRENHVPAGDYRTWVENYTVVKKDGHQSVHIRNVPELGADLLKPVKLEKGEELVKSFNVPKLCNHCTNTPCSQVCPVNASFMTPEGVVLVDKDMCIGCGYCVQACPYGTRYISEIGDDEHRGIVDKCTWCYHRIQKGIQEILEEEKAAHAHDAEKTKKSGKPEGPVKPTPIPLSWKTACVEICPYKARLIGNILDPDDPIQDVFKEQRLTILKPEMGTEPKTKYIGLDENVI